MLKTITAATVLLLLTSCSTNYSGKSAGATPAAPEQAAVDASAPLSTTAADLAGSTDDESGSSAPTIYRGTDRQVKMPPVTEPIRFLGEDVSINFEQAPLSEVMHAIMGDILQLDYVVDQPVTGEVTLRTRTPIPRDELFGVLESLLKANNVLMIRGSDGRYLVTGAANGARLSPRVSNPHSKGPGFGTIVVPLQYISASNMAEILQPVATPDAFVRVDNTRNLLMLAGTGAQLDGWLEMVSTFDVDMLAGMSVGIFPLENSSSEEVYLAISALLSGGGGEGGPDSPGGQGGDWSQLIRVIPIARLNSILVVTPRAHYLDIVQKWITRLDDAYYSEADMRLYVYPVQNTTAERLAKLLNSIYSGSMTQQPGSSSSSQSGSRGFSSGFGSDASVAPGMNRETIGSASGTSASTGNYQPFSNNDGQDIGNSISTVTMAAGDSNSLLGNVRVVADEENNALMIYSTGLQYRVIKTALDQLDVEATQVVIEASILEVTLTDKLRYGLEWTFKNGIGDDYNGRGLLTSGAASVPSVVVPGFSYAVTNSIGDISAVLNALSEDNLINVISTPSVMVLDNHDAYIHVGDQVPVVSGETINDSGFATQNVTYRDTGVQLNVRPSVNAGGLVTMQIEQSVTDVGTVDARGNPTFLERAIMSRVAVRSHESVVLGGLIRENAKNRESGVPFLHKLPVIGPIFGTVEKEDTRTELLVIITPRAIYNEQDLREVSEEMRSQIRHMELIEMPAD
ncbi:MAG: type II secretion system secretin GspD [Halieaceae bacterium]|nr:type II secretion system secretin GspD [Halieaceae bacterium]